MKKAQIYAQINQRNRQLKIGCKLGCLFVASRPSKLASPLIGKFIIAFFET
jgi:hypothetical protein